MSDVDVFVIDDDFDPLADLSLDDGERDDAEADYLPPIPDADKSVVPPVVPLSAAERIENLLAGIPGQQFRLLHAVEFCTEPKTMDEAVADLDAAYPNTTSVYCSAQVVQLLERDGALERIVDEDAAHAAAGDAADALAEDEGFISVTPAPPCRYRAKSSGASMPPMSFSMPSSSRWGMVEMRRKALWCSGRLTRITGRSVPATR